MHRKWLIEARRKKGWTQTELAARSGLSQTFISSIEKGTRGKKLPVATARALASTLGFDWQDFYADTANSDQDIKQEETKP